VPVLLKEKVTLFQRLCGNHTFLGIGRKPGIFIWLSTIYFKGILATYFSVIHLIFEN